MVSLTQSGQRAPADVVPSIGAPQLQQRILEMSISVLFVFNEYRRPEYQKAELISRLTRFSDGRRGIEFCEDNTYVAVACSCSNP